MILLVAAPGYSTVHNCGSSLLRNPITRILLVTATVGYASRVLPGAGLLRSPPYLQATNSELLLRFYN